MSFLDRIRKHHGLRMRTLAKIPEQSTPQPLSETQHQKRLNPRHFLWIAEVKQASPSRGDLAPDVDPVAVAQSYVNHGADMLSVLTEPHFFKGSLDTLAAVRAACPDIPLLMKDFILDPLQIAHGQAAGANAFLLIMALLSDTEFQVLYRYGLARGLLPLVELHSEDDLGRLERAVQQHVIPAPALIGVNHRCLHSLNIDLNISKVLYPRLRERFPQARLIAESGLSQARDILDIQALGYQGCLVGSAFMAHEDPGQILKSWKTEVSQAHPIGRALS